MTEKDIGRLKDIISAAAEAQAFITSLNGTNYMDNLLVQRASERCVEIIGEAASHISDEVKLSSPHIPWRSVKAMRNLLIHQYGNVDSSIVFQTVTEQLPVLSDQIKALLKEIQTP